MNILIVRHGIAEEISSGGDSHRALTEEGRCKIKQVATGLARIKPEIERIYSSPLVRAEQTAQIIAESLRTNVEIMIELSPGHSPMDLCQRLSEIRNVSGVMLVGHEPNCSELASYLLGSTGEIGIDFKKGAACFIQATHPIASAGTLLWHLPPRILRLIN